MKELQRFQLEIDEYVVSIYVPKDNFQDLEILNEAQQRGRYHLKGPYSVDEHPPVNATGQYHLHVYWRNTQLLSVNQDGTGHDDYHGKPIPNKIREPLGRIFPQYEFPSNWILESIEIKSLNSKKLDERTAKFMADLMDLLQGRKRK